MNMVAGAEHADKKRCDDVSTRSSGGSFVSQSSDIVEGRKLEIQAELSRLMDRRCRDKSLIATEAAVVSSACGHRDNVTDERSVTSRSLQRSGPLSGTCAV